MKKYIYFIEYNSVPGMYTQYDGKFSVRADDEEEAMEQAYLRLKNDCFKDRTRSMWKFKITDRVTTI